MKYGIRIYQRVGVDMDDEHGEQAGDGAALVELANLAIELIIPFVPYPGLTVQIGAVGTRLEDVIWVHDKGFFGCHGEPIWRQTRDAAATIIESLIDAGFHPHDPHREAEVH